MTADVEPAETLTCPECETPGVRLDDHVARCVNRSCRVIVWHAEVETGDVVAVCGAVR